MATEKLQVEGAVTPQPPVVVSKEADGFLREATSQGPQASQVPSEAVVTGKVQDGEFD